MILPLVAQTLAGPGLHHWESLDGFLPDGDSPGGWRSPVVDVGAEWDEVVPSWNAAPAVRLRLSVRALYPDGETPWFDLGTWTGGPDRGIRTSAGEQRGPQGRVATDTVVLTRPARRFQVRLHLEDGRPEGVRRIALGGALSTDPLDEPAPWTAAWGRELEVPVESQAEYPEGVQSWCSPTSLTMILGWWSAQAGRPEWSRGVRSVAAAVHDPGWPGTGNWSFNVAHAGSHPGLAAVVARLGGVVDLERWIDAGLPVAVSVSYACLKGAERPAKGDGHLVVVCGFTAGGDVVVNDPGVRRSRVRRTVPRSDFIRAWGHSRRTAYLVRPEDRPPPPGGEGRW